MSIQDDLMKYQFKRDENEKPHCWNRHMVTTQEAKEVFERGQHFIQDDIYFIREGFTSTGRKLRIICTWLIKNEKVRIITAYDI